MGFFANTNKDFFRYLIDVSLLIFMLKFKLLNISPLLITGYYLLLFIYNFYHNLFWKIYDVYPAVYNDWSLIKTGLAILWKESKYVVMVSFLGGSVVLVFIYFAFSRYLSFVIQSPYYLLDIILAFGFLILFIVTIARFNILHKGRIHYADRRLRFVVGILRIYYNIRLSNEFAAQGKRMKTRKIEKIRQQPEFKLRIRPNIFFLFIESYGSILMQDQDMLPHYKKIYRKLKQHMNENNWGMVSNLSRAPSSSAYSWLCYSSFLYGYNISLHAHYERFLKNPIFYNADNLFRILKNKGYTTCFLNPIKPNPRIKIEYQYLTPFYAVDRWILFEHLNYKGDRFGFGDFPPDQYSLNRGREIIENTVSQPYALLFLSKNSHSPFASPLRIENDWKSLNHSSGKTDYGGGFLKLPKVKNYLTAIQYQLEVITHFIKNTAGKNDLYFIVGDHQPPVISSREKNGLNTPVHIISKDDAFLKGFLQYGFRDSLFDDSLAPVRHESMYSAFLREFIKNYGIDYQRLPEYEPYGLQI